MYPPKPIRGVGLNESGVRSKYNVTVVGVKTPGKPFPYAEADTVVSNHDLIIVSGTTGDIERFAAPLRRRETLRGGRAHAPGDSLSLASSFARASAASVASSNDLVEVGLLQHGDRPLGRALRARDLAPQLGGVSSDAASSAAAPMKVCSAITRASLGRSPCHGRLRELLDEQEEVGRARTRRSSTARRSATRAPRPPCRPSRTARRTRATSSAVAVVPAASPVTAAPTTAGVLGIDRSTATSGPSSDSNVAIVTPAARLTTSVPGVEVRGDLAQQVGNHRRLHADEHDAGGCRGLGVAVGRLFERDAGHAVEIRERVGLRAGAVRDRDSGCREARAHEPLEDRAAHRPRPDDRDGREGGGVRGHGEHPTTALFYRS